MVDYESTLKEKRMDISTKKIKGGMLTQIYITDMSVGRLYYIKVSDGMMKWVMTKKGEEPQPSLVLPTSNIKHLRKALKHLVRPKKEAVGGVSLISKEEMKKITSENAEACRNAAQNDSAMNQFDNLVFKPASSHIEGKDYKDNQEDRNKFARDLLDNVKTASAPIGLPYDWSLDCSKELMVDVCHWSTKLDKAVSSMWSSFSDNQKKAIATQCNKATLRDAQERLDKMLVL